MTFKSCLTSCSMLGEFGHCDFRRQPESTVCWSKGSHQAAAWKCVQWMDCVPDCQTGIQNGMWGPSTWPVLVKTAGYTLRLWDCYSWSNWKIKIEVLPSHGLKDDERTGLIIFLMRFCGRQFVQGPGVGGCFWVDWRALHSSSPPAGRPGS